MSVREVLREIVASGAAPGAAAAWGDRERLFTEAVGGLTGSPETAPVTEATLFDLASLTKPLATASVCMVLAAQGRLDPDAPVDAPWAQGGLRLAHLLRHDGGAPAYCDLAGQPLGPEEARRRVLEAAGEGAPGGAVVYSCVGYIRLADVLERTAGRPLDRLFDELVRCPLGLGLRYLPESGATAPTTAWERWRRAERRRRGLPPPPGPWLQGEPHDPLAWLQGGVSGNAGLFGSALDVGRFAQAVVRGEAPFPREVWGRFTDPARAKDDWVLGWHLRSREGSSAGDGWGPRAVGHTGYTGTSLWLDADRGQFAALLTAAVHPHGDPVPVRRFRPLFGTAALATLGATA